MKAHRLMSIKQLAELLGFKHGHDSACRPQRSHSLNARRDGLPL
ncbi:hypothetical protein [Petrachloros mirabilis]